MFGLWFPVIVFVVCGFQHVVANAFIIPAAIFTKYHNQLVGLFAEYIMGILGNAVGGSLLWPSPLIFMTKPATIKPRVENDSNGGAL